MIQRLTHIDNLQAVLHDSGLSREGVPTRVLLGNSGRPAEGFIKIADDASTPGGADVLTCFDKIASESLCLNELVVSSVLKKYEHAHAIALIGRWIKWLKEDARMSVVFEDGRWRFGDSVDTRLGWQWTSYSLTVVLEHLGLTVDIPERRLEPGICMTSGVRLKDTLIVYSMPETIWRLANGPLCSLGYIAEDRVPEFVQRCLSYFSETTPASFRTPQRPARNRSERLRILHTVEYYAPHIGGAELVVQKLSEKLAARGHHVTVATRQIPERAFSELNGVDVEQFEIDGSAARGIRGKDVRRYQEFLGEFPYDVMLNYAAQQWATDLAIPLVPRLRKKVNIIAPCGYSALKDNAVADNAFFNYFCHFLPCWLPQYDAAVCHSAVYQDYIFAARRGMTNHLIIPNAVDEAEFERAPSLNFREKYGIREPNILLCVANFLAGKGQERAINALRNLRRDDTALVLIGKEGPMLPALRTWAKGLNVKFLVDIPRTDTLAAYHSAQLFVFCSHVEASPLVILEAKAARLPFVSTDVGNVKEWKGGRVCEPKDLAMHIGQLLDDAAERKRLADQGWQEYRDKLTWTAVTDSYENLYQRLVAQKRTKLVGQVHINPASFIFEEK